MIKKRKIKNPQDKVLLKQIIIDRKFEYNDFTDDEWIKYRIILNDKEIGHAYYLIGKDYISVVWIDPKYQRKGLATYLYDYIENDQNIRLKSDASTRSGIAFWKNRLKTRKNPRDEKLSTPYRIIYKVLLNDKELAKAQWDEGYESISWIEVKPEYQRLGLATYLYDYIEQDQNIKLRSSGEINTSLAAKAFWENRLKQRKNPISKLEQFRLNSIAEIKKDVNYLSNIVAENINSSRFEIYIVGSVLNRNKFNENSDIDLAIVIYDKRLANGWNEKLTDQFRDIFQKIPFNFGFLDISVHNNELLPKQEKLKIYDLNI